MCTISLQLRIWKWLEPIRNSNFNRTLLGFEWKTEVMIDFLLATRRPAVAVLTLFNWLFHSLSCVDSLVRFCLVFIVIRHIRVSVSLIVGRARQGPALLRHRHSGRCPFRYLHRLLAALLFAVTAAQIVSWISKHQVPIATRPLSPHYYQMHRGLLPMALFVLLHRL